MNMSCSSCKHAFSKSSDCCKSFMKQSEILNHTIASVALNTRLKLEWIECSVDGHTEKIKKNFLDCLSKILIHRECGIQNWELKTKDGKDANAAKIAQQNQLETDVNITYAKKRINRVRLDSENKRKKNYNGPGRGGGRGAVMNQGNKQFQPGNSSLNQSPQTTLKAAQQQPNVNQQQPNVNQQQSNMIQTPKKIVQPSPVQPESVQTPDSQKLKPILKLSTPSKNQSQKVSIPAIKAAIPAPLFRATPIVSSAPLATSAPVAPAPAVALASAVVSTQNIIEEVNTQDSGITMDTTDQPRWKRNKIPGTKANRKLKRLRMDQRLRKTLMPKNAIMVLNEMKAGVQFVFPETPAVPNSLFLVHAQLDGKTYVGQGLSKILARQNAAENAFKCLVLEKMATAAKISEEEAEQQQSNFASKPLQQETEEMKTSDENQTENNGSEHEINMMDVLNSEDSDNIPWRALANFALHKLLNEWQNQGTVVLMPRSGAAPVKKSKPEAKPVVAKELPLNAELVHPVMLLNQMRPGTTYAEVSRAGNPPNTLFTIGVNIDGKEYTGTAKNKKEAKKATAMNALTSIYGLVYPEESKLEPMDTSQSVPLAGFVAQKDPSI